jgi:hypothetical protein
MLIYVKDNHQIHKSKCHRHAQMKARIIKENYEVLTFCK